MKYNITSGISCSLKRPLCSISSVKQPHVLATSVGSLPYSQSQSNDTTKITWPVVRSPSIIANPPFDILLLSALAYRRRHEQ